MHRSVVRPCSGACDRCRGSIHPQLRSRIRSVALRALATPRPPEYTRRGGTSTKEADRGSSLLRVRVALRDLMLGDDPGCIDQRDEPVRYSVVHLRTRSPRASMARSPSCVGFRMGILLCSSTGRIELRSSLRLLARNWRSRRRHSGTTRDAGTSAYWLTSGGAETHDGSEVQSWVAASSSLRMVPSSVRTLRKFQSTGVGHWRRRSSRREPPLHPRSEVAGRAVRVNSSAGNRAGSVASLGVPRSVSPGVVTWRTRRHRTGCCAESNRLSRAAPA